jgi:hypothetical protein
MYEKCCRRSNKSKNKEIVAHSMLNKKSVFIITSYMSSKRNIMKIRPIWKQYLPEILQFEQDGSIYFDRNPEWNAMSASIFACASKVYDWKPESTQYEPLIPLAFSSFLPVTRLG